MCGPYVHYVIERGEPRMSVPFGTTFKQRWFIRAGINIATGEPCTNVGIELSDEEKDTLRWHFVSEYPTWRDLWRKHIKPHFGKRGDGCEWTDAFDEMVSPKGLEGLSKLPMVSALSHTGRSVLARFLWVWRHPENRAGYWANPQEPVAKPTKPVALRWRADANSHAELLETKGG